jgi:tetratricopeptide (TPR) repeat protein
MQVQGRLFVCLLLAFIPFFSAVYSVKAAEIEKIIQLYENENYEDALILIQSEIEKDPEEPELYNWMGKTYEALFDIENSIKAYNKYNQLKKKKDTLLSSSSPLNETSATSSFVPAFPSAIVIKTTPKPIPTNIKVTPKPLPSKIVISKPTPTPKPTIKPTPKPTPTPKQLAIKYSGWSNIDVLEIEKNQNIKIIPLNSSDLVEVNEKAPQNYEFITLSCKIKYTQNIIIKNNSDQIFVEDDKKNKYNLYSMSTFIFKYQGNKQSKKVELLQNSKYYELSTRDSRKLILLAFLVPQNTKLLELNVLGYNKKIDLSKF